MVQTGGGVCVGTQGSNGIRKKAMPTIATFRAVDVRYGPFQKMFSGLARGASFDVAHYAQNATAELARWKR